MEDAGRDGARSPRRWFFCAILWICRTPPARKGGKVIYPLDKVLLLCLLAVLVGAEAITDIARSGDKKLDLQRRFVLPTARPRMIISAIS